MHSPSMPAAAEQISALEVAPYPMIKEIKADFISDNQLMRNLLSWQVSDRPVAIIIHRVGPTLILEDGSQLCAESSLQAVMVSSITMDGRTGELPPPSPADFSIKLKKNPLAQREKHLLSKLQSQLEDYVCVPFCFARLVLRGVPD